MPEITNNTFGKGMQLDIDASLSQINTYLKGYNIRIASTNNDNFSVSNIDGMQNISAISSGFIPIGVAVYNNVCFIVSKNTSNDENEIGTFPSPKYNKSGNNYDIKGEFENTYKPLINLQKSALSNILPTFAVNDAIPSGGTYTSADYGDFRTTQLKYDFNNKLEIELQKSYDDSVNIIIVDNKNSIRIINSLFAIYPNNSYAIINRTGNKDTNLYTILGLLDQTKLVTSSNKLLNLTYQGLYNGGKLKCGNYRYYFFYTDSDGNESPLLAVSNVTSVYFLNDTDLSRTRGGRHQEETSKNNKFLIQNLDTNYANLVIYFSYSSNDNNVIPLYYKLNSTYSITSSSLTFVHTGFEGVTETSSINLSNTLANVESFKTITQAKDYLFGANTSESNSDYEQLRLAALDFKAVPEIQRMRCYGLDTTSNLDSMYSASVDQVNLAGGTNYYNNGYHNPLNIYNSKGYFGGESVPIGVVFILKNFKETPVFPVTSFDNFDGTLDESSFTNTVVNALKNGSADWVNGSGTGSNTGRFNRLGILRFPQRNANSSGVWPYQVFESNGTTLYINVFGVKIIYPTSLNSYLTENTVGCYFVRGERKPNLVTQGVIIPTYKVYKNGAAATTHEYSYHGFFDGISASPTSVGYAPLLRSKLEAVTVLPSDENDNWDNEKNAGLISSNYGLIATGSGGIGGIITFIKVFFFPYSTTTASGYAPNVSEHATPLVIPSSLGTLLDTPIDINNYCFVSVDFLMNPDKYKVELNKSQLVAIPIAAIKGIVDMKEKYKGTTVFSDTIGMIIGTCEPSLLSKIKDIHSFANYAAYYNPFNVELSYVEGGLKDVFNTKGFTGSDTRSAFYTGKQTISGNTFLNFFAVKNTYNSYIGFTLLSPINNNINRCFSDILNKLSSYPQSPPTTDTTNLAKLISIVNGAFNAIIQLPFGKEPGGQLNEVPPTVSEGYFSIIQNIYPASGYWATPELQAIYGNLVDTTYFPISQKYYFNSTIANNYGATNSNLLITNSSPNNYKILYEGDCYINSYFHLLYKNSETAGTAVERDQPVGKYFQIVNESVYNSAMRDNSLSNDLLDEQSTFAPYANEVASSDSTIRFGSAINGSNSGKILESNYTNKGLGFMEYIKNKFVFPTSFPFLRTKYSNRIYHSLKNVPEQFINNYRTFLSANYKDYANKYGEIVHIENMGDNLLVFMEHAIGMIAIQQRVQTGSDVSGDIFIKPSEVLSPIMNIINYNFSTRWQSSIVKSDNAFYCIDVDACKIIQITFTGQVTLISDFVIQSFLKDTLNLLNKKNLDVASINVTSHFDRNYNEIRFNVYNLVSNELNYNIVYNENLKSFISFYSYSTNLSFNIFNKHYSFSATNKSSQDRNIYEHNVKLISGLESIIINKNKFYDRVQQPSMIKFTVNDKYFMEKVFDNLTIISNNVLPLFITYYVQGAKTRQTIVLRTSNNVISSNAVYREEKGYVQIPSVDQVTNKDIYDSLTDAQSNVRSLLARKSRFRGKAIIIEFEYLGDKEIRLNSVLTHYRTSNN